MNSDRDRDPLAPHRCRSPIDNQSEMIVWQAKFSTYNPSLVGNAFASDLTFRAPFSARVNQFNTVRVNSTDKRRIRHKNVNEMLMPVE